MTDQAMTNDSTDAPSQAGRDSGKQPVRKLLLLAGLALGTLAAAGGAAHFAGLSGPILGGAAHEQARAVAGPAIFFDLPEMVVNLSSGGRKSTFLKISVSLELADGDHVKQIEHVLPRIIDSFQVYLRELRIEDLSGSAGLQRLREELLLRVNTASHPAVVNDVLFKEMLVQ